MEDPAELQDEPQIEPAMTEAGFKELGVSVTWWEGRKLRFEFPSFKGPRT